MVKIPNNDFDPNALTQQTDEHTRNIAQLQASVSDLEKRVGTNENLADTFNKTFESSKKLDEVIVKAVVSLIKTNNDVSAEIATKVKESDRDWQKLAMKRIGFVIWTLIVAILSGAAVAIFKS